MRYNKTRIYYPQNMFVLSEKRPWLSSSLKHFIYCSCYLFPYVSVTIRNLSRISRGTTRGHGFLDVPHPCTSVLLPNFIGVPFEN